MATYQGDLGTIRHREFTQGPAISRLRRRAAMDTERREAVIVQEL